MFSRVLDDVPLHIQGLIKSAKLFQNILRISFVATQVVVGAVPTSAVDFGQFRLRPISTSANFRLRPISPSVNFDFEFGQFDFGQFRLQPISTSANFDFGPIRLRPIFLDFGQLDFGQFRLRPISTSVNFDFGQVLDVVFLN